MLAITFNSTNTINSFFDKYRIHSIEMGDVLQKVLALRTGAGTFNNIVPEEILRNVFDCIIVNLKRYHISDKFTYRNWLRMLERNKQKDNSAHAELNEYFEEELKNLFPKTSTEYIFGSWLPKSLGHFSRREGPREGRGKTKKNRQKNREKKYNQSKKRKRRRKKRNTKK
jgi:hypothetical protein